MTDKRIEIIADICPFYKEYGSCERCNAELDTSDEPCYYECIANAIINNGYRKQREGKWIFKQTYYEADECNCSVCGQLMTTRKGVRMSYCPNCGAKMKGGDTDA